MAEIGDNQNSRSAQGAPPGDLRGLVVIVVWVVLGFFRVALGHGGDRSI